ncbi:MAG: hypothetical protein U0X20_12120 [Caldilineaceae bacterium]
MSEPYKEVKAGDPILAKDWNSIQSLIREHILTHTHGGGDSGAEIDVDLRSLTFGSELAVRKLEASDSLLVGPGSKPLLSVNPQATNAEGSYQVNVAGTIRADQVRTARLDGVLELAAGSLVVSSSVGIGTAAPGDSKLKVGGDAQIVGALAVESSVSVGMSLVVNGESKLNGQVTMGPATAESLAIAGQLSAEGSLRLNGRLDVSSSAAITGDLSVTGRTGLKGRLDVDNDAGIKGRLDVSSSAAITGDLSVTGRTTLNGGLTIAGSTALNGDLTVGQAAKMSFGAQVRQMINLWNESYGIGVQNNTLYFRTGAHMAWYKQGAHDNGEFTAGAGGTTLMVIRNDGNVAIGTSDPGGNRLRVQGGATYLDGTLTVTGATTLNGGLTVNAATVGTLRVGTGMLIERFDDGTLGNSAAVVPTARAVKTYVDAQVALMMEQLKAFRTIYDRHQHRYIHYTYRDITAVNVQNWGDTQSPNPA